MYGVTKITNAQNILLVSFQNVPAGQAVLAKYLNAFADLGIVIDMISQSAPRGAEFDFSFTADSDSFGKIMMALPSLKADGSPVPLISSGYSKINLFGKEMVTSCGVAARALGALSSAGIEVVLITTSDLDISVLVRSENEDAATQSLKEAFAL